MTLCVGDAVMTHRTSTNFIQSRPPTLRLDGSHARRQSENAVILPIVYELPEPNRGSFNPDSVIVPITWPLRRFVTTSIIPLEFPDRGSDRKKKLALLKRKVESARERAAQKAAQAKQRAETAQAKTENKPTDKAESSPTAVPLLLLSAIVLVVLAWACFR